MKITTGRWRRSTPSSDISARMPPSPSLSTLIARLTYFIVVMAISVHTISDSTPRIVVASGRVPVTSSTVLKV